MLTPDPIMRVRDVCALIQLSRVTLYRMEDGGRFPRRHRLGPGTVGWHESEVKAWLASLSPASNPLDRGHWWAERPERATFKPN